MPRAARKADEEEKLPHTMKFEPSLWAEVEQAADATTSGNVSEYVRQALRAKLEADRKAKKR